MKLTRPTPQQPPTPPNYAIATVGYLTAQYPTALPIQFIAPYQWRMIINTAIMHRSKKAMIQ